MLFFLSIALTILIAIDVEHTLSIASTQSMTTLRPPTTNIDYAHTEVVLLKSDSIYSRDRWEKPVVVEEYNLIFFTIPNVACTEFKLLFHQ